MRVITLPIGDAQWREFTASQASATPFHLPEWADLIADCYRFEAFVLGVQVDGDLVAGLPVISARSPFGRTRWISLPFSDYCPPLARPGVSLDEVVAVLREHVIANPARELEVRAGLPSAGDVYPVEVGHIHQLALPADPADLHPHRNYRQHRNQAARKGIQVSRGDTAEDVATFYRLHTLTRRRLGVPVQPKRFFDLIWERLIRPGSGFVATASLDGEILTAAVYLGYNGTLIEKYRASDPDRQDSGAGHLLDWEIMSAACTEGYHTLDLGRTDPGSEGLRTYKTRLGAREEPLVYTHVTSRAPKAERPKVGGLSQRVIRVSPVWVCRGLGEVFYRWSA